VVNKAIVEFSETRLCIRAWKHEVCKCLRIQFCHTVNYVNSHFCWWRSVSSKSAFGICASKWRILDKAIETKVDTGVEIVKCISLLHNIITDFESYCCLHSRWSQHDSLSLPPTRATRKQRTNTFGRCYQPERPFCTLTRYTLRRRTAPLTYTFLSA
jgi:hypothetical protein